MTDRENNDDQQAQPGEATDMQALEDHPTPPPARGFSPRNGPPRNNLNTRIIAELDELMRGYADANGSSLQGVIEQSLTEYFQRRGLLPDKDEQR